jgi:hypothetical protein
LKGILGIVNVVQEGTADGHDQPTVALDKLDERGFILGLDETLQQRAVTCLGTGGTGNLAQAAEDMVQCGGHGVTLLAGPIRRIVPGRAGAISPISEKISAGRIPATGALQPLTAV